MQNRRSGPYFRAGRLPPGTPKPANTGIPRMPVRADARQRFHKNRWFAGRGVPKGSSGSAGIAVAALLGIIFQSDAKTAFQVRRRQIEQRIGVREGHAQGAAAVYQGIPLV